MGKKKGKLRKLLWILAVVLLVAGCFAGWVYCTATRTYKGHNTRLYLPRGTGSEALADSLNSILKSDPDFATSVITLWNKIPGTHVVKPGAYEIEEGEKAIELVRRIQSGRQTPIKLRFNGTRALPELYSAIANQMEFDETELTNAADAAFKESGINKELQPAYFLPDTYEVYWTESPEQLLARLNGYYERFWNDGRRHKAQMLGLTPQQIAIVASIVEEETNKRDERGKVARVYLNRLKRGMKLQADPTVKFAVGDFALKRILNKHLSANSPYNTYLNAGLPPGPIRIPEKVTLDAVLNAPSGDWIYMCAKEDFSGYHNFASDYASHQANAVRYRQALDKRGIK